MCPVPRTIASTQASEGDQNNNDINQGKGNIGTSHAKKEAVDANNNNKSSVIKINVTVSRDTKQENNKNDIPIPKRPTSHFSRYFDYSYEIETSAYQLSLVEVEWSLKVNRLAANCRNISDEVFPGIHLGDRCA